jgi:hypothetical protein
MRIRATAAVISVNAANTSNEKISHRFMPGPDNQKVSPSLSLAVPLWHMINREL